MHIVSTPKGKLNIHILRALLLHPSCFVQAKRAFTDSRSREYENYRIAGSTYGVRTTWKSVPIPGG